MQMTSFIREFLRKPSYIGAIAPSSSKLAYEMVQSINFQTANTIVELGPGTGAFTRELISRKRNSTKLILVEINEQFAKSLQEQYSHIPNIIVIHGSAEQLAEYLESLQIEKIDYIISGLPFTSLPKDISDKILSVVKDCLEMNGLFITFQYSLVKKQYIENFFNKIKAKRVWFNFPPAYVLTCEKEEVAYGVK